MKVSTNPLHLAFYSGGGGLLTLGILGMSRKQTGGSLPNFEDLLSHEIDTF